MTIFGPDISSFQNGLLLSRLAEASFIIAKTTEGTYYTDADYQGWRLQAAQLGKPFAWYHFLSDQDATAQAEHTLANVGDRSLPGMLDAEPAGSFSPTLAQIVDYVKAAHAVGLNLRLVYLPRWYWQQMGSPDLSELAAHDVHLVSSEYPGATGAPSSIYPGDDAAGWQAYGGMTPLIYQFTNKASDGGQTLDYNAFRGSIAELATALNPSGDPVGTYTMSAGWQNDYPDVAAALQQHIPVGEPIDEGLAAAYAMIRSFVAAARAGAIDTKLDTVIELLKTPAPAPVLPPVDVDALAAALAPHLAAGSTADQIAHAVVMHLGADLAAG